MFKVTRKMKRSFNLSSEPDIFLYRCSMFGIRDEISSGIWENDETREIRWEELRWKRSETKADEPRGQEVLAGRK